MLSSEAKVTVTITDGNNSTLCDDCKLTKVDRKGETIDSFLAYVSSSKMSKYNWSSDSKVTISIINGDEKDPLVFRYQVSNYKDKWILSDTVTFEEI